VVHVNYEIKEILATTLKNNHFENMIIPENKEYPVHDWHNI
jgi:hypothetical protein